MNSLLITGNNLHLAHGYTGCTQLDLDYGLGLNNDWSLFDAESDDEMVIDSGGTRTSEYRPPRKRARNM